MEKKIDDILEKVEPSRRDFMKKLAIGTVYAVPVMATFSLDSVRSKAFAQTTYKTDSGGGITAPEWAGQEELEDGLRITFTQPMDTSFSPEGALRARGVPRVACYNRQQCFDITLCGSARARTPNGAACESEPPEGTTVWRWDGDQAQIVTVSGTTSQFSGTFKYRYNDPTLSGCINFRGKNGLDLVDSGWHTVDMYCDAPSRVK